ncbi:PhzF family phenazine biosynthesis protein [Roseivirga sp. E12]|uniref:PhzF family phenazine biosynthesis protein n=1 Tax=Roseivirga sp. E12 TaxID=2819237 RepID=UPI001ABCB1F6|nr:PhzF family phenazine biosynthesis protein [Roseivirga sp. E12]MBO3698348.1 PhzF family phenazine biosynthesis protein [Roseivirga sp. E12]
MRLFQIDSFTQELFKGNPAAVCIVDRSLTDSQMQQIAVEMNLSETAFVKIGKDSCNLRWFTPAKEVPLCGHATLASAYVLFNEGYWSAEKPIIFNTLSGELIVTQNYDSSLSMDFPSLTPVEERDVAVSRLEELFGGEVAEVLTVPNELIVIFRDLNTLLNTNPNSDAISNLAVNGVIVSAWAGNEDYDFASRYFAPNLGIKEDPVTGFMHTILTPYWSKRMERLEFKALQASDRTGKMTTKLKEERVILSGDAIKVFETELSF